MSKKDNKVFLSDARVATFIKYLWFGFFAALFGFILFVVAVSINFLGLFGDLPDFKALEDPKSNLSSELYSADGVLLGKYFRHNRTPVEYNEISNHLINALIATEDIRFREHSGIDLQGMGRVAVKSLIMRQSGGGGGSTLSQQTAKNLFRTRNFEGLLSNIPGLKMLIIKTKEWIVATQLEKYYTKDEILCLYLNTFEYGSNAYGIKTASNTFFSKNPNELNLQEAATLVGLFKNPNYYSPVYNPESSLKRRNTVLSQMRKYDFLTMAQYDSIAQLPLELQYKIENHNEGLATYFREGVSKAFLIKWASENLRPDGKPYNLFEDGLKIVTTIDSRLQQSAEEAVQEQMKALQASFDKEMGDRDPWIDSRGRVIPDFLETQVKRTEAYRNYVQRYGAGSDSVRIKLHEKKRMRVFSWEHGELDTMMSTMDSLRHYKKHLQVGFMASDPHTGHIKAWVGGINHKHFKYDHVKQGKRQPGSTFKPFVYAAAIENGYGPCYEVMDQPVEINIPGQPTWVPQNANKQFTFEKMNIREAMARSINSVTAFMMKKLGPQVVVETAHRLGITSPLDPVPALSLGTSDVSIMEMVGAFGTFANKGEHIEPFFIDYIMDKNGNVLQQFTPRKKPAMSEEHAYLMLYMLRGGLEEKGGTSQGVPWSLRDEGNEIGGKTGTTQNASDGWYMGVTKDLVSGVWVGGDDRAIHFRSGISGQGGRTALPIWIKFMEKAYADPSTGVTKGPFEKPDKPISIELDCNMYNRDSFDEYDFNSRNSNF